jgi:hypothetical protein
MITNTPVYVQNTPRYPPQAAMLHVRSWRTAKSKSDCDRTVMRQAQNLDEHRGLPTHTDESFWRANSLIAYALTCLGVARCRSTASLSKRAPSTTRTSLRSSGLNSLA